MISKVNLKSSHEANIISKVNLKSSHKANIMTSESKFEITT